MFNISHVNIIKSWSSPIYPILTTVSGLKDFISSCILNASIHTTSCYPKCIFIITTYCDVIWYPWLTIYICWSYFYPIDSSIRSFKNSFSSPPTFPCCHIYYIWITPGHFYRSYLIIKMMNGSITCSIIFR